MNVAGHIAVAARADAGRDARAAATAVMSRDGQETADRWLGAALPDLASMGRFRLLGQRRAGSALTAGIRLHHLTDSLFHRHHWFTTLQHDLSADLIDQGVSRGPARACSHVGIELLLDGALLVSDEVVRATEAAFERIDPARDEIVELVDQSHRTAWRRHLAALAEWRLPADYGSPEAVAGRLQRILSARPRLALPARHVTVVAGALAERNDRIRASAADLVDQLAVQLGAELSAAESR